MKYGEVIKLGETHDDNPCFVELVGYAISVHDMYDDVHLTPDEAKNLVGVLTEHFNL